MTISALSRSAIATALFLLTVATGIGVIHATVAAWPPIVHTARLLLLF